MHCAAVLHESKYARIHHQVVRNLHGERPGCEGWKHLLVFATLKGLVCRI